MEAEVRGDTDQVLRAAIGEEVSGGILPAPIVEDALGPSKEAEVKDIKLLRGRLLMTPKRRPCLW
ncbi:UNVERIFIED_CONTAM: hypothetical protein Sangu_1035800, partial [Sesamum angustifolium]